MGRSSFDDAAGMKRGPWTAEEDQKLLKYIQQHGHGSWSSLPHKAGLKRCGKSCRLRWINYLNPDIKRGNFSLHEEQTIIQLHALLGNRWSTIAMHLPKRTDNEIKNHWNTHLKKRLARMGIDPNTHKPISKMATTQNDNGDPKKGSKLSHMAQWESARLEAEARSVKESKLRQIITNTTSNIAPCLDVVTAWQKLIEAGGEFGFTSGNCEIESPEFNFKFPEELINNYNGDDHQNEGDVTMEVACNRSIIGFGDQNFTQGDINGILKIADEIYGGAVVDQEINNCYWNYI